MARIKTMTRLVATLYRAPAGELVEPGHIMARINEDLCLDNRQDMFVTVFFGVLDPATAMLTFCNAGHQSPYVISKNGDISTVEGPRGIPLGILGDYEYETGTHQLARGDCVFVYTDGVTEAMDPNSAFFTDARLKQVLAPLAGAPARAVVAEVIASVRDFAGGAPQADDIAAMAIRLTDVTGPDIDRRQRTGELASRFTFPFVSPSEVASLRFRLSEELRICTQLPK